MDLADTRPVNLFDVVALGVLVLAVIAGIRTGALPQVGGISGAVIGLVLVLNAAPWLLDVTGGLEPIPRALVVLGGVLGAVILGETIGSRRGRGRCRTASPGRPDGRRPLLRRPARRRPGHPDHLARRAGSSPRGRSRRSPGRRPSRRRSARLFDAYLPPPTEVVGEIAGVLDSSGLPDVFVGLEPIPLTARRHRRRAPRPSASPAPPRPARPGSSTRACGMQVNGTGVIVAHGYVVTNAHVVAGATTIRVTIGSDVADATAVLFDPDLDVAAALRPRPRRARLLRFAADGPGPGHHRRGPRVRRRRTAGRAPGGRLRLLRGDRPRHLRQEPGHPPDPGAARRGGARRLRAGRSCSRTARSAGSCSRSPRRTRPSATR